jgi:cytochrome c oxidase assembly protein subunit 11
MAGAPTDSLLATRHRRAAVLCIGVAVAMAGLAYASVPLYRLFCQVTGYGGTTQKASKPSDAVLDRTVTVRFDANIGGGLAWSFAPVDRWVDVKIGETKLTFYRATNTSDRPMTGMATFNVAPEAAGAFFYKIECFCFKEQRLEPGESAEMPVSFFVDPAIVNDKNAGRVSQITLSYTFFPVDEPKPGKAATAETGLMQESSRRPDGEPPFAARREQR